MAQFNKIQPIIYEILESNPVARNDDYILMYEVLKRLIPCDLSIEAVFKNHVQLKLPSLVSIPRIRRKLQVKHPHLQGTNATREQEEQEYRAYAKI